MKIACSDKNCAYGGIRYDMMSGLCLNCHQDMIEGDEMAEVERRYDEPDETWFAVWTAFTGKVMVEGPHTRAVAATWRDLALSLGLDDAEIMQ